MFDRTREFHSLTHVLLLYSDDTGINLEKTLLSSFSGKFSVIELDCLCLGVPLAEFAGTPADHRTVSYVRKEIEKSICVLLAPLVARVLSSTFRQPFVLWPNRVV